eukprot:GDKI01014769.1.p2 GENE.GDKI01014769.1~~GDKI01014769.1.p2  ORF type:complete len:141 (-),score=34.41 GDKI01014769.1:96-518(-)
MSTQMMHMLCVSVCIPGSVPLVYVCVYVPECHVLNLLEAYSCISTRLCMSHVRAYMRVGEWVCRVCYLCVRACVMWGRVCVLYVQNSVCCVFVLCVCRTNECVCCAPAYGRTCVCVNVCEWCTNEPNTTRHSCNDVHVCV